MLFNRRKWFGLVAAFAGKKAPALVAGVDPAAEPKFISGCAIAAYQRELDRGLKELEASVMPRIFVSSRGQGFVFSSDNFQREITVMDPDGARRTVPINTPDFHRDAFKL